MESDPVPSFWGSAADGDALELGSSSWSKEAAAAVVVVVAVGLTPSEPNLVALVVVSFSIKEGDLGIDKWKKKEK